jgi:hypothetical protein
MAKASGAECAKLRQVYGMFIAGCRWVEVNEGFDSLVWLLQVLRIV